MMEQLSGGKAVKRVLGGEGHDSGEHTVRNV